MLTADPGNKSSAAHIRPGVAECLGEDKLDRRPLAIRRRLAQAGTPAGKQRLEHEVGLLAGALRSLGDGVLIVEHASPLADSELVFANHAIEAAGGYAAGELVGRSLEWFCATSGGGAELCASFARALAKPGGPPIEWRHRRRDGREYDAEWMLSPVLADSGAVTHSVCVQREITARKGSEQMVREAMSEARQAQAANRAKSEFLAGMSHELRTPLNCIIGFAELLHDGKLGALTELQRRPVRSLVDSAHHLLTLVDGILDLAKIEVGRLEITPGPCDLAEVIDEVAASMRPLASEKGLRLEVAVHPGARDVFADSARLKQILYNYLSNAIKFTPAGGRIVVRASAPEPDQIRLEVEDTGAGIPCEDLARLFSPFERLNAASKSHPGTGLGLALTKRLVEAQAGRVEVRSQVGKGSVFTAVLPRRWGSRNVRQTSACN
ncbi:MAG: PAS domain-containing sensor histidine kinase [Acidobacteria bacterium]|nr:PAS domain-containing sensor histidine kinase [Acidobacteriota bacterium]MBI3281452.1 PAS domain-containing sensor histidine kinase [Acidobacteriota bacterium]